MNFTVFGQQALKGLFSDTRLMPSMRLQLYCNTVSIHVSAVNAVAGKRNR
jgi:hypothetical protein